MPKIFSWRLKQLENNPRWPYEGYVYIGEPKPPEAQSDSPSHYNDWYLGFGRVFICRELSCTSDLGAMIDDELLNADRDQDQVFYMFSCHILGHCSVDHIKLEVSTALLSYRIFGYGLHASRFALWLQAAPPGPGWPAGRSVASCFDLSWSEALDVQQILLATPGVHLLQGGAALVLTCFNNCLLVLLVVKV